MDQETDTMITLTVIKLPIGRPDLASTFNDISNIALRDYCNIAYQRDMLKAAIDSENECIRNRSSRYDWKDGFAYMDYEGGRETYNKSCHKHCVETLRSKVDGVYSTLRATVRAMESDNEENILYGIENNWSSMELPKSEKEEFVDKLSSSREFGGILTRVNDALNYLDRWQMYNQLFADEKYAEDYKPAQIKIPLDEWGPSDIPMAPAHPRANEVQ